jgi:hypothetical protein
MKNATKVNQKFSNYKLLLELAEAQRREVNNIESKKYVFCTHFTADKPSVNAWECFRRGAGIEHTAWFEINEDTVSLVNRGVYSDEIAEEMLNIIQDWLQIE